MPGPAPRLPRPSPSAPSARWSTVVLGAGLVLIVVAYANSLRVPFLLDDTATLGDNPSIHRLADLASVLQPPAWSFSAGRPLLNLSFALNYWAGGADVRGYHVVNLALHLINVLLLHGLLVRLLRRSEAPGVGWVPVAAAVLWGLHPVQTASVTYVSQRAEVLMATCYLGALLAYVRGWEGPQGGRWRAVAVAAVATGVLVKEVAATAPLACLALEVVFLGAGWLAVLRRRWATYAGFVVTWLLLAAISAGSDLGGRLALSAGSRVSLDYAVLQLRAWGEYLTLPFWPHPLVFDRGSSAEALACYPLWRGAVLLGLLGAAVALTWRRWPRAALLGGLFLLILAPTSSVVPVWGQPIAENRLYLPLAAAVVAVLLGLIRGVRMAVAVMLAAGMALLLAGLTFSRNATFGSAERIWTDTVAKAPANVRAHGNLGVVLLDVPGRWEDAVRHLEDARRLAPGEAMNHYQLGRAHAARPGGATEAERHFRDCLRLQPGQGLAHAQLALILIQSGRGGEALGHLESAVRLRPDRADFRVMLGGLLQDFPGREAEAVRWLEGALREVPGDSMAWMNLGNARMAAAAPLSAAVTAYREACRVGPGNHLAWYNLALALLKGGDWAGRVEAQACLREALRLVPTFDPARRRLEQEERVDRR